MPQGKTLLFVFLVHQLWDQRDVNEAEWAMQQPVPRALRDAVGQARGSGAGAGSQRVAAGPDLFVDIGANVGWFTVGLAARGFNVAAFEGGWITPKNAYCFGFVSDN